MLTNPERSRTEKKSKFPAGASSPKFSSQLGEVVKYDNEAFILKEKI